VSDRNDAYPPRLSQSAAEVDAGPEGPDVGAFFDLDGTLVAGYTAGAQTRDRLRRRDLRVVEFLTIVQLDHRADVYRAR
jgi:putative phosphoserine phosphatase / 1-acylglycerol-3-phosphate O-acyltransferase